MYQVQPIEAQGVDIKNCKKREISGRKRGRMKGVTVLSKAQMSDGPEPKNENE